MMGQPSSECLYSSVVVFIDSLLNRLFTTVGLKDKLIVQVIPNINQILAILMHLNNLNKNLDAPKSRLKSLDLKNLDEKKKVDLERRENLYTFKKLVLTLRMFLILILIGLYC